MNYEHMTLAELEAENNRLGAEKEAIRGRQRAVKAAMDAIIKRRHAESLLASVDTEVLAEALRARGTIGGVA